jgi:hypothetical protein
MLKPGHSPQNDHLRMMAGSYAESGRPAMQASFSPAASVEHLSPSFRCGLPWRGKSPFTAPQWEKPMMTKTNLTVAALGLICLAATGCVSEGGSYSSYQTSPRYDRSDNRPPPDLGRPNDSRRDRFDRDHRRDHSDRSRGDSRWEGSRDRDERAGRDRRDGSRPDYSDNGRWEMRDGRRVWIPQRP